MVDDDTGASRFDFGFSSANHDCGLALFGLEFGHMFVRFNVWLMRVKGEGCFATFIVHLIFYLPGVRGCSFGFILCSLW